MPTYTVVLTHSDSSVSVSEDLEAKDEKDAFRKSSELFREMPPVKFAKITLVKEGKEENGV